MSSANEHIRQLCRSYGRAHRLTAVEEYDLVVAWQREGNTTAREKLMSAGMKDVVAISRKYSGSRVPLEDLVSEGALGLMTAIDRFDPERGLRLVTYSSHWIRARISRCITREWKRGRTGIGSTRMLRYFKIKRESAKHLSRCGDELESLRKTASQLNMSLAEVRDALESMQMYDTSLDGTWNEEDGRMAFADKLTSVEPSPFEAAAYNEKISRFRESIDEAMDNLDERERLIATERLMLAEPRTLRDLGARLGISRERVRQIEVKARSKLSVMLTIEETPLSASA